MTTVLSLKELRSSSALKAEIKKLEEEKQQLEAKLDRQKQVEKKLNDDISDHKKDFEHLEKQFNHFAGLEAEFETLQQEVLLERLERIEDDGKKDSQLKSQVKKAKEDMAEVQAELKELKKLDPQRLKKQVTDLKKKNFDQAKDNKNLNTALVAARKELREVTAEKDTLTQEQEASSKQTNFFWESQEGHWALYETGLVLKSETADEDALNRILCLNRETGVSVVSKALDDNDAAQWVTDMDIPEAISIEAGKRLKKIAAEAEEDDD